MKPIYIVADTQRAVSRDAIYVTQNDSVQIIVKIQQNGKDEPLATDHTYTLTSMRRDGVSVMSPPGVLTGTNEITFDLGTHAIAIAGKTQSAVQIIQPSGRVSSLAFVLNVVNDVSTNFIPSENEQTLIEMVLYEAPAVIQAAKDSIVETELAVANANAATEYVESRRELIEEFTGEQTNLQAQLDALVVDGDSSPEAAQARVGTDATAYTTLKARLDAEQNKVSAQLADTAKKSEIQSLVVNKAEKTYVDSEIAKKASGAPRGVHATLSALQTALPTGSPDNQLVTADGFSYYWNGSAWMQLTQYQSTGLADKSVTAIKRTALRELGFLSSFGVINIDTVNKVINLNGISGVIFGKEYYSLPTNGTISLANTHPYNGGTLGYDVVTKTFIFGSESLMNENCVTLGMIWLNDKKVVLNATTYTVNGVANVANKSVTINHLSDTAIAALGGKPISQWSTKKWNVLGDSISTVDYTTKAYYQYVNEALGFATVNNYGISSTEISTGGTYPNPFIGRYTNMDSTADLITVFGGLNDYLHDAELGTFASRDNATFYGAMHNLCIGLYTNFSNAKIAFFTPTKVNAYGKNGSANAKGYTLSQYVNAVKEVCAEYSIPVLDLQSMSGLTPHIATMKTKYQPDGCHPNALGHNILASKISSFLNSL